TVFILFAFIVSLALLGYFSPRELSTQERIASVESSLRQEILVQAVQEYFGQQKGKESSRIRDAFPKELLPLRAKDLRVARLYIVSQFQEGKKITPADLTPLSRSASVADTA